MKKVFIIVNRDETFKRRKRHDIYDDIFYILNQILFNIVVNFIRKCFNIKKINYIANLNFFYYY